MKTIVTAAISAIISSLLTIFVFTSIVNNGEDIIDVNQNSNAVFQQNNNVKVEKIDMTYAISKIYDATVFIQTHQYGKPASTGSGFVYKVEQDTGYILTNHHVVEGADTIEIVFSSGKVEEAKLVASDKYVDIAVLEISTDNITQVATLGKSEDIVLGESVITIGSPLGFEFMNSVTQGNVSGLNRFIELDINGDNRDDWKIELVQIDAAINPGNSGGPLVNSDGEVIGINTIKFASEEIEAMGFSIPIDHVLEYATELEQYKKIIRPTFGIGYYGYDSLTSNIKANFPVDYGVYISNVLEGLPADKAGLESGDLIVSVNGVDIHTATDFTYELYKYNPGDEIEIEFYRNNEKIVAKVLLNDSKLN